MRSIIRDTMKWLVLVGITIVLWAADLYYPHPYLYNLTITFFAIAAIYLILRVLFENITLSRIEDNRTRYSFRKGISMLFYVLILVSTAMIWVQNTQALLVSYGIVGAGLAIALQDVFRNFAGSFFILTSGLYTVGDRIEMDGKMGDVIDIGLWNTTLMEIEGWVHGDQPTGRITLVPNGAVIASPVFNYSKDFTFVWDEITVPLTYNSDWKEAIRLFTDILKEQNDAMAAQAERAIEQVGAKYYIIRKGVEPSIYLTVTSNWVEFALRYVVDVRQRRPVKHELSRKVLEAVEKSENLEIGSSTMIVTGRHEVTLEKENLHIDRP